MDISGFALSHSLTSFLAGPTDEQTCVRKYIKRRDPEKLEFVLELRHHSD